MSGKFSNPRRVSIFKTIAGLSPPERSRRCLKRSTSRAVFANESSTTSACSATNAKSSMSFAVIAGSRSSLSGRLMPLSARNFAPRRRACLMRTTTRRPSTFSTTPPILPSSNQIDSPARTSSKTSGIVQPISPASALSRCDRESRAGPARDRASRPASRRPAARARCQSGRAIGADAPRAILATQDSAGNDVSGLVGLSPTTARRTSTTTPRPLRAARIGELDGSPDANRRKPFRGNRKHASASDGGSGAASLRQPDARRRRNASVCICAGRILTTAEPGSIGPVRNFGPPRSITTRHDRPSDLPARRKCSIMPRHVAASSCAQLMRMQSMPRRATPARADSPPPLRSAS